MSRTLPRTPIAELVAGEHARIEGIARRLHQETSAPFSGRSCLAAHSYIFDHAPGGGLGQRHDAVVPFVVEDDTGSIALVVGTHVELQLAVFLIDDAHMHAIGASIIRRETRALGGGVGPRYEHRLDFDTRVSVSGAVLNVEGGGLRLAGTQRWPLVIVSTS